MPSPARPMRQTPISEQPLTTYFPTLSSIDDAARKDGARQNVMSGAGPGKKYRYKGTIPLSMSPWAVANIGAVFLELTQMCKSIPLEAPWDAPKAKKWDQLSWATRELRCGDGYRRRPAEKPGGCGRRRYGGDGGGRSGGRLPRGGASASVRAVDAPGRPYCHAPVILAT